jgi:hypothetical protein
MVNNNRGAVDAQPLLNIASESEPTWLLDHFSVKELMVPWKMSHDSVTRLFRGEPGVIKLCPPHRRGVRTKRTLRIPGHVVERVYKRLTQQ